MSHYQGVPQKGDPYPPQVSPPPPKPGGRTMGGRTMSHADIDNFFTYHPPTEEQARSYVKIREAAKVLAEIIMEHTPTSADQTAAIRKLRECVMTANAAIACHVEDK